jgi:DNA repair protein RecN (Recombination protein N)
MLSALRIKNLAIVVDLTIEFQPGYNVVTGETGAGKSILIGALDLVLGGRADRTLIRSGSESCSVEAIFDISKIKAPIKDFLDNNALEPCDANQLLLRRTVAATGANRQFINGSPTTLSVLNSLGEWLVDMHGPHDHQSLLQNSRQLDILDAYGKYDVQLKQYASLVREYSALIDAKAELIENEQTYAQQIDLWRFQCQEIESARLQPDEDLLCEQEYQKARNAAKLLALGQEALNLLADDEQSVLSHFGKLGRTFQELERIDPEITGLVEQQKVIGSQIQELQKEINHYLEGIEVDPERLNELEERLNLIQSLKRKYGTQLIDVTEYGKTTRQKLEQWEQREAQIIQLRQKIVQMENKLKKSGVELTRLRQKATPSLVNSIKKHLSDLGLKQCLFDAALKTTPPEDDKDFSFCKHGFDQVEFLFAPNVGEPPRPLRSIASSGEMARVMLAIKTVLAAEDEIPLLVFDEVDANIGGETACAVGEKMRRIGRQHQVLCITHLAPVAAYASTHFHVWKEVSEGRTQALISEMNDGERINELARMLGGASEPAKKHAASLLKSSLKE